MRRYLGSSPADAIGLEPLPPIDRAMWGPECGSRITYDNDPNVRAFIDAAAQQDAWLQVADPRAGLEGWFRVATAKRALLDGKQQGCAEAIVTELQRRQALYQESRQPLTPDGERVDAVLRDLTGADAGAWAASRAAFAPATPPPPEALPGLVSDLEKAREGLAASEERSAQDIAQAEAEAVAAETRRDDLRREVAQVRRDLAALAPRRLGYSWNDFQEDVEGAGQGVINTARRARDSLSHTFLPSQVRDYGRSVENELQRAGYRIDRQLRRSVQDIATKYGPWLRVVAGIIFPLGHIGLSLGLALVTGVVSAEVSYTYHQKEAAERAAADLLRLLRQRRADAEREAAALTHELEIIEAALEQAMRDRGRLADELAAQEAAASVALARGNVVWWGAGLALGGALLYALTRRRSSR